MSINPLSPTPGDSVPDPYMTEAKAIVHLIQVAMGEHDWYNDAWDSDSFVEDVVKRIAEYLKEKD